MFFIPLHSRNDTGGLSENSPESRLQHDQTKNVKEMLKFQNNFVYPKCYPIFVIQFYYTL